MFSTGTNLLTHLLKRNCYIPARFAQYGVNATKEQLGMRWQVPWGKHTDPGFRNQHAATHAQEISKNDILPVVTIRNVWTWMQSMCHHPYAAQWEHYEKCPHLKVAKDKTQQQQQVYDWNNVTVTYGAGKMSYQSLVHLWNDWYSSYMNPSASYPLIMIRMEDLVFHTESTISQVCACAGGQLQQPFQFVHDSAKKDSPGHDTRTGYVEAWIKYGKPMQVEAGFDHDDYQATMQSLSRTLMDTFSYQNPPSSQG
ncbi:hypothetical protein MPSEU_000007700 [Mayamaea pseudoterrestris]|nr:hypothetical protein MPSEU_000007700 [Mayamaea pseudoterrestris]